MSLEPDKGKVLAVGIVVAFHDTVGFKAYQKRQVMDYVLEFAAALLSPKVEFETQ